MQKNVKTHPAILYYILVLVFSGALLVLQNVFTKAGDYSVSFPQLAPTLAVISICVMTKSRKIWTRIVKSFFLSVKNIKWIPVILVLSILIVALTACILSLAGIPYQPWKGSIVFHLINIVAIICGCMFEEIGWRGYLLPILGRRYSLFISTLIVGILWGFWHMSFNLGIVGFLIFIISAIELSILITWVYYKSDGNLFLMTLWHASINTFNQFFLRGRLTSQGFTVLVAVLAVICFFILIFNKDIYGKVLISCDLTKD